MRNISDAERVSLGEVMGRLVELLSATLLQCQSSSRLIGVVLKELGNYPEEASTVAPDSSSQKSVCIKDDYSNIIEDLEKSLREKDEEISGLNNRIAALRDGIEAKVGELDAAKNEIAELRSAKADASRENEKLRGEIADVRGECENFRTANVNLQKDLNEASAELDKTRAECRRLETSIPFARTTLKLSKKLSPTFPPVFAIKLICIIISMIPWLLSASAATAPLSNNYGRNAPAIFSGGKIRGIFPISSPLY